ncbi:MAG: alpha amylase C-terminal domain-containing protein, partial [Firmicutes bacterium]|nr:alpha amylase C-terminal domain-containing protein [Candidatus Fiminaster equi]
KAGIGVIVDFAPVHFATDAWALVDYDGANLFEPSDPNRRFSPWGSAYFDLGKDPVRSFLMSAMNYFVTECHVDGLRIDAVSNILYYEGNKALGRNEGSIEFLKRLNARMHDRHSSLMMIAEDSTDFPGVTKPTEWDGIGFDYKWDLGWMNDTLKYYSKDPVYKKYEHNKLTFSMAYFFNENFMLPFSHDEVVHGKGTLVNKLWGDYDQKFMQLRNLIAYQYAHPGKKLNFMGNELGTFDEWNEIKSLAWNLKSYPMHDSFGRLFRDLNLIYKAEPAMYMNEYNPNNFNWLEVDNSDQSIFAFERFDGDSRLVFVFNMTPNYYEYIEIPVTQPGTYTEIFNSEKDVYNGCNQYNGAPIKSTEFGPYGRPHKITIKLASFGACIFKYKK